MIFDNAYLIAPAAYLGINLATFLAFGWDKHRAIRDQRRISEAALLRLALLGGSLGAKIAQRHFRHKTYKQPFGRRLNTILWLQVVLVPPLLVPQVRAGDRRVPADLVAMNGQALARRLRVRPPNSAAGWSCCSAHRR